MRTKHYTRKSKKYKYLGGTLNITSEPYSDIISTNEVLKSVLGDEIIPKYTEDYYKDIDAEFNKKFNKVSTSRKEWTSLCDKNTRCGNPLFKMVDNEIKSTVYMLRLIYKSIKPEISKDTPLFSIENHDKTPLTGKWEDDSKYINLNIHENEPRLIMGFGPSASGKTFNTETIIKLLSKLEDNFPTMFLTIDGGIAREQSMTYQYVINEIHNKGYDGLSGLVNAIPSRGIFNSDTVKRQLMDYLQIQKDKGNKVSLYVPETLGGCLSCDSKYEKFREYTNDEKWIGLNIWQHKEGKYCKKDANYPEIYRCKGCSESGTEREKNEGKKYSNSQWSMSYANGQREMKKAGGGCYEIHNAGRRDHINTFIDHTNYVDNSKKEKLKKAIEHLGWRYFYKKIEIGQFGYVIKGILEKMFGV
jgi:hypothetical protein